MALIVRLIENMKLQMLQPFFHWKQEVGEKGSGPNMEICSNI